MRISFRFQLWAVFGGLVLATVGLCAAIAYLSLREDKAALISDVNRGAATNLAAQVDSSLYRLSDSLRLFVVSQTLSDHSDSQLPPTYLQEAHIIGVRLFKKGADGYSEVKLTEGVPSLNLENTQLTPRLKEAEISPLSFWNTPGAETPRFFVATRLEIHVGNQPHLYIALAEIDPRPMLSILQQSGFFESFLVSNRGMALLHVDRNGFKPAVSLEKYPLFQSALANKESSAGAFFFRHEGMRRHGAYAKVSAANLYLLSEASEEEWTAIGKQWNLRAGLLALLGLTTAMLLANLFAHRHIGRLRAISDRALVAIGSSIQPKVFQDEVDRLSDFVHRLIAKLKDVEASSQTEINDLKEAISQVDERALREAKKSEELKLELDRALHHGVKNEKLSAQSLEILNALKSLTSRLEACRAGLLDPASAPLSNKDGNLDPVLEVIRHWEREYQTGGFTALSESLQGASSIHPDLTVLEEDIENLKKGIHFWIDRWNKVEKDLEFLALQTSRVQKAADVLYEKSNPTSAPANAIPNSESRTVWETPAVISPKDETPLPSTPKPTPAGCHAILRGAIREFTEVMGVDREIVIEAEFRAEEDQVPWDEKSLHETISSILGFCSHALSDTTHPRLLVETSRGPKGFFLVVEHNGKTMTKESIDLVFQSVGTNEKELPFPLSALAEANALTKLHGGLFTIRRSDAQSTTRFELLLPVSQTTLFAAAS